ncbi:MAG: hypothetical protein Q7R43_02220 [Candidatus Daviesbacteria bacterium]|nr:hypothetical protein [Candidatus Daviesbacteria bacterium]
MLKYLFVIVFIALINPWIYHVINFSYLLGFSVLTLSLLLALSWHYKKRKSLVLGLLAFLIPLIIYLLFYKFNGSIFTLTPLEKDLISQKHSYYAQEFGKFYGNRFTIYFFSQVKPYIDHLSQNLANSLDILEFFSWNQKIDTGRYLTVFLPFFLIGIFNLRKNLLNLIYLTVALVVSSLTIIGSLGPILLLPFINLVIFIGFLKIFNKFSLYKKTI